MKQINSILNALNFKAKEDSPEVKNFKHYLREFMTFEEYELIRDELKDLITYENKDNVRFEFFEIKQQNFIFHYIKQFITQTDRKAFLEWLVNYDGGKVKVNHKANQDLFKTLLNVKLRYQSAKQNEIFTPAEPLSVCIIQLDANNKRVGYHLEPYDYNRKYMIYNPKEPETKDEVPTAYEQPPKRRY